MGRYLGRSCQKLIIKSYLPIHEWVCWPSGSTMILPNSRRKKLGLFAIGFSNQLRNILGEDKYWRYLLDDQKLQLMATLLSTLLTNVQTPIEYIHWHVASTPYFHRLALVLPVWATSILLCKFSNPYCCPYASIMTGGTNGLRVHWRDF